MAPELAEFQIWKSYIESIHNFMNNTTILGTECATVVPLTYFDRSASPVYSVVV